MLRVYCWWATNTLGKVSRCFELQNKKKGLWKDKEISGLDACWLSVKVNKNDILYFIDEVNLRCKSKHQLDFIKKKEKDGIYLKEKEDVMNVHYAHHGEKKEMKKI